jgi:hypothetical protein
MTSDLPRSDPPFGADTDEAVSALLDGELAAFASDHGTTEADVRARLEAWPGFADRRAALGGADAAIATPVPALDDVTRRRLVRAAGDARAATAVPPRGGRVWKVVGAVAAALVIVVGIGLAIDAAGDGGDRASDSAASSARTAAPDLHGDLGDVGDLSGPGALRALLTGTRAEKSERTGSTSPSADATRDQSGGAPAPANADGFAARSSKPARSPDQCAAQLAGNRPVTFVGTGTYRGRPATVVGLTEGGRVIAFVVPSDDCTDILTSLSR